MHALKSLHAALRPHGLILDVRPAPAHPVVEIVRCSDALDRHQQVLRLGQLDDSFRIGTLATADAALQMLVDAGRFVRERTEVFTFLYHFDTVDVWLAYMSENWSSAHVSVEVIARAQQAFLAETGELRIVRSIEATRLRRT